MNEQNDEKSCWDRLLEPKTLAGIAAVITAIGTVLAIVVPPIVERFQATPSPTEPPAATQVSETPTVPPTVPTHTPAPPPTPVEKSIESFESYSSDEVLRASYSINAPFNDASVSLAGKPNVYDGTQALAFFYDIHTTEARDGTPTNYAGLRNTFASQDWAGFNFLRLWVRSDGSNRKLVVQFREASEEAWEYTTNLDRFGEKDLELRLDTSEFQLAEWSPYVNGQIDLGAIVEFSVYVGEAGKGQGTIYIDAIRLSK